MKAEDKSLLVKAICGYLPYNHLRLDVAGGDMDCLGYAHGKLIVANHLMSVSTGVEPELAKPYLRPMSNITEVELNELEDVTSLSLYDSRDGEVISGKTITNGADIDWLNEHCFDYRGLIDKELALPAPEGMYDFKE